MFSMILASSGTVNFFTTIGNFFSVLGEFVTAVVNFLLFFPFILILAGVLLIAFFAEMVFKKLAGIDTIYLGNTAFGGANNGGQDLVYAFITEPAVQDVFWAIVSLSFVLLFVFTIVALIKSEFTLDLKGSAKSPIIARALKSLVNFAVVPVVTLISIIGVNFLTKTVYDLFSTTGDSVVVKCFYVGAYNANRARLDPVFAEQLSSNKDFDGQPVFDGSSPFSGSADQVAYMIDQYFLDGTDLGVSYNDDEGYLKRILNCDFQKLKDGYVSFSNILFQYPKNGECNMLNAKAVNFYYDLSQFDYILAIGSAVCMAWILLTTCLVLVKRVFELTILFLLAPAMTAIAPLDGGQAEKKWRQEFMKRLLAVIGPIFAFNMYFLLVPLFSSISLFGAAGSISPTVAGGGTMLSNIIMLILGFTVIFDILFQLICVITGMSIVKSASGLLSTLLGIEDLVKSGGEAGKKAVATGMKAALLATGVGGAAVKGAAMALKGGKAALAGLKNAKTAGGKSAKAAKSQLKGAEADVETRQKDADTSASTVMDLEDQARESKAYKDNEARISELTRKKEQNGGVLSAEEDKELTDAMVNRSEIITKQGGDALRKAREKRDSDQEALAIAQKNLGYRQSGVSKEDQQKIENWETGKTADGKQMMSGKLVSEAKKKAREFREQASKGGLAEHLKANYDSEFGANAAETSMFGKFATNLNKKAQKFKGVPLLGKIPDLTNSFKEQFAIDGETAKRRLNDGIAGIFGDSGAGDLWKIWFNKNTRANLYEGVPESKKRTAAIEAGLSWGGKAKYDREDREKKDRDEQERLIRRMLAEQRGLKDYESLIRQRENATNPTEIQKLDAKIEKMEINNGLKDAGKTFYDNISTGGREAQLQAYKDKMATEAAKKAAESDYKAKAKATIGSDAYMAESHAKIAQKTKTDAEEKSQLAKALADALGSKLSKTSLKIDPSALKTMFDGMNFGEMAQAINALAEAVEKLEGGK